MSVPHKTELEWSGNIGTIEYTNSQCLKISIGSNRARSGQGTKTSWMTAVFTTAQTKTFAPKFAVGDALHVKGELSVGSYNGAKTMTLFVRQVVEHEPKGVRYLAKLHTTAAKLGNQQVLNLMRDEVQLHNLFWHMMGQVFPGTPMPQQMERQPTNQAPAQVSNVAPAQQQQSYAPQPEQRAQQQSYTPQPEQPAQQQSYAPQPEQPVQQQSYAPQPEQPVQQQSYASQPEQEVQPQASSQQLGHVALSSLPQDIIDQIVNYQSEGGAPAQTGDPDFLHNPELTVPDAVRASAHEIASAELQNTDNFFKPQ